MTIDEAIKICEEDAEKIGGNPQSDRHAERCRQLAEWLRELKQWRRVYGVCPSYEMCIPECKEGYNAQMAEYKRLLKMAVEDIHDVLSSQIKITNYTLCEKCKYYLNCNCKDKCITRYNLKQWRFADEALKLIGEEDNDT